MVIAPEALLDEWLGPGSAVAQAAHGLDPFMVPYDHLADDHGWLLWLGHPPVPDGLPLLPVPDHLLWGEPITALAAATLVCADYAVRRGAVDAATATAITIARGTDRDRRAWTPPCRARRRGGRRSQSRNPGRCRRRHGLGHDRGSGADAEGESGCPRRAPHAPARPGVVVPGVRGDRGDRRRLPLVVRPSSRRRARRPFDRRRVRSPRRHRDRAPRPRHHDRIQRRSRTAGRRHSLVSRRRDEFPGRTAPSASAGVAAGSRRRKNSAMLSASGCGR